jgi:hypothetical protein
MKAQICIALMSKVRESGDKLPFFVTETASATPKQAASPNRKSLAAVKATFFPGN